MKNICVFCGSSKGKLPIYQRIAEDMARILASNGCTIVYGGGRLGLMGCIADTALLEGGSVVGIIPEFMMPKEVVHLGLTELIITSSMHTRKYAMANRSDAFLVLPGGLGTLDEMAEILTWNQLSIIQKPIVLLNVNKYYDPLLLMMDKMVESGFLRSMGRDLLIEVKDPESVLTALNNYKPDTGSDWFQG